MNAYEIWGKAFDERRRLARDYLAGMQAARATNLPAADQVDMIRILARAAKRAILRATEQR